MAAFHPFGRVQVWRVPLDRDLDDAVSSLSAEERARAGRFADPAAARRFVTTRAALRRLLGRRLGEDPRSLAITTEANGRPILSHGRLVFSVSHSGRLALCAIAEKGPLGVDLEALRPMPAALALAAEHLGAAIAGDLARLGPGQRAAAFLAAWTGHEARLKATGAGLAGAAPPPACLAVSPLELPPGYVGALAHPPGTVVELGDFASARAARNCPVEA